MQSGSFISLALSIADRMKRLGLWIFMATESIVESSTMCVHRGTQTLWYSGRECICCGRDRWRSTLSVSNALTKINQLFINNDYSHKRLHLHLYFFIQKMISIQPTERDEVNEFDWNDWRRGVNAARTIATRSSQDHRSLVLSERWRWRWRWRRHRFSSGTYYAVISSTATKTSTTTNITFSLHGHFTWLLI